MSYEELSGILDTQQTYLIKYAIDNSRTLPAASKTSSLNLQRIAERHIIYMSQYFRSSDIDQWKTYLSILGKDSLTDTLTVSDLMAFAAVLFEGIVKLIKQQFSTPDQLKTQEKYLRRLEGMRALAQSTVIASNLKKAIH